jgi:hypothetical protein
MGTGNVSAPKNDTTSNSYAIDQRLAAADQGMVVRGGEGANSNTTLNVSSADATTLRDIASGAFDFLKVAATQQGELVKAVSDSSASGNQAVLTSALDTVSALKQTELTGGASDLQKTVLIGLAIGVGGMILLSFSRKAKA